MAIAESSVHVCVCASVWCGVLCLPPLNHAPFFLCFPPLHCNNHNGAHDLCFNFAFKRAAPVSEAVAKTPSQPHWGLLLWVLCGLNFSLIGADNRAIDAQVVLVFPALAPNAGRAFLLLLNWKRCLQALRID